MRGVRMSVRGNDRGRRCRRPGGPQHCFPSGGVKKTSLVGFASGRCGEVAAPGVVRQ